MRLIGTAGHVDHGKSTLVKALTGINPDRLKEEQDREMTIDLGFAWMTLPSGQTVSLIDVPGHEAFIKNMLAGVGAIDAALLVVAADEGIMPQTREHLSILDLLRVKGGVVALTKTDLVSDPEWLELVQADIAKALEGTALEKAPIVPVSARTGIGLAELKTQLDALMMRVSEKEDRDRPRLPIDRAFTIAGFGTVVTGTLSDGPFGVGDEVEIEPGGIRARIRGIQTHKEKLTRAAPGGRVALNLAGVSTEDLYRGQVVMRPGSLRPTALIDARIRWLSSAPHPLVHSQELDLFAFAAEVPARVRLLMRDELKPGEEGWAQLVLSSPIVVERGDRFILRYASPSLTVGGGTIVDAHPSARHRRNRKAIVEQLEQAGRGSPSELVLQYLSTRGPAEAAELERPLGLEHETIALALRQLLDAGQVFGLREGTSEYFITTSEWSRFAENMAKLLSEYHRRFPLRSGMPREEFKNRSGLPARAFEAALQRAQLEGILRENERVIFRPEHQIKFEGALEGKVQGLLAQFARAPYSPPSLADAEEAVGQDALAALVAQGQLTKVSDHVLLLPQAESEMTKWVVNTIHERGQVTAAELRDRFNTSRKYAVAFLEYLDARRVTRRVGDARVLR